MMIEELLQTFIRVVDAQLFKCVELSTEAKYRLMPVKQATNDA
jgi:hypothetical protein